MKALVKARPEPGLWLQNVPEPACGPEDVLIKIRKTAICGTDLHIFNWDAWSRKTIKTPLVIGHEFVGEIAAVGANVTGFKPGQRVSGEGHLTCGICRNCRAGKRHLCPDTHGVGVNRIGCFTEYLVIPAINVYPVPDSIDDEIASILDPFGNAAHTAFSFDLVGEDVLDHRRRPHRHHGRGHCPPGSGARFVVITDVNDYRLDLARQMGVPRPPST